MSSGTSCSEQGSGRWLPKPSDTFNKFILMSNPSVGYKDIPLLWIQMVDVSKMIGFVLPDWIADILPGEYPVHTKDGIVKQNFKGAVLKFVTGETNFMMFTTSKSDNSRNLKRREISDLVFSEFWVISSSVTVV